MTRRRIALGAALIGSIPLLAPSHDARAADKTWVGGSGNWTTAGNWTPFGAPLDFDNVFIGPSDALNRTVTYNVNDGFLHAYNNVVLQPSGAGSVQLNQTGPQFGCASLSLSAFASLAEYRVDGAREASTGFLVLGALSRLTVSGGAEFTATAAQQFGGTLAVDSTSSFVVNGSYLHNHGSVSGPFRNNGVLTISSGPFGGNLDNFGSIVLPAGQTTTFTSFVTNHTSYTLSADRGIAVGQSFTQAAGTFTQFGPFTILGTASQQLNVGGPGGATWDQVNATHTGNFLDVGAGGPGTYLLRGAGASITLNRDLRVGVFGDGSFAHMAGRVQATDLEIGSAAVPATRGLYTLSDGTLRVESFLTIANGTLVQTGGFADVERLNLDSLTSGNARLSLSGGSMTVNERSTNNGTIVLGGSASVVMTDELVGAGSLTVTATSRLEALRIQQNSVFIGRSALVKRLAGAPPPPPHYVQSLTFEPRPTGGIFGQWDLGRASLVIDYGDEPGASPATTIRSYLSSGYAGGSWNGNGLITTGPSLEPDAHGLGMAEASDVIGPAGGNFEGMFVDATAVLVKFVRYGDANLDGTVNLADFNRLASNFGGTNKIWSQGDFTYDGIVNLQDFNRLAGNFGRSTNGAEVTPEDWAMLASAIPEPTCALALLAAASTCVLRRRRSRRH